LSDYLKPLLLPMAFSAMNIPEISEEEEEEVMPVIVLKINGQIRFLTNHTQEEAYLIEQGKLWLLVFSIKNKIN
jgi:hypothetical protein